MLAAGSHPLPGLAVVDTVGFSCILLYQISTIRFRYGIRPDAFLYARNMLTLHPQAIRPKVRLREQTLSEIASVAAGTVPRVPVVEARGFREGDLTNAVTEGIEHTLH